VAEAEAEVATTTIERAPIMSTTTDKAKETTVDIMAININNNRLSTSIILSQHILIPTCLLVEAEAFPLHHIWLLVGSRLRPQAGHCRVVEACLLHHLSSMARMAPMEETTTRKTIAEGIKTTAANNREDMIAVMGADTMMEAEAEVKGEEGPVDMIRGEVETMPMEGANCSLVVDANYLICIIELYAQPL
jgi:hypothetical protein